MLHALFSAGVVCCTRFEETTILLRTAQTFFRSFSQSLVYLILSKRGQTWRALSPNPCAKGRYGTAVARALLAPGQSSNGPISTQPY